MINVKLLGRDVAQTIWPYLKYYLSICMNREGHHGKH